MKSLASRVNLSMSSLGLAVVLVFVILNLAVFLLRAISVWHYGKLFPMQGGEDAGVFPVWKAVHHLHVYTWPLEFPFSLALYNYLFYYTYASFLKLFGVGGADIMIWGRALTPAFVLTGATAQWKLVQHHLNLRGARSALSFFFALSLWTGSSMVRGYALSIRPDMAAIALVMVTLLIVVRQPRFGFVYAGVLFYLAWSFKETVILALVAVCMFLMVHKRWDDLSKLTAVFGILVGATLLIGSPEYRFNILVAPAMVKEYSIRWALQMSPKAIAANVYWILAPVALALGTGSRRLDGTVRLLITILAIALVGGLTGMTRVGAWDNYVFEAFVAGSTLLQIAVFGAPSLLVSAFVLFGCVQPAVQLATMPNGSHPHTFGTVGIATAAEYADAVALRDRLATMKKPIFTSDPTFSLPWYSNDNRAPALVIDYLFHEATRASCRNGCIEGMLQHSEIPTVMLLGSGDVYQGSLSANYKKVGEGVYCDRSYNIYALNPQRPTDDPSNWK